MEETYNESEVLEGIVKGNTKVIAAFYKKNLPMVRNYILKNSGNETDSEDVFQDGFVFLFQKLKEGDLVLECKASTYLYAVCRNIWRNRLRKQQRMSHQEDIGQLTVALDKNVVDEIEEQDQEALFRNYFLKLSDKCKTLLTFVFEGDSMKTISGKTGYSEGYARKKKFECKKSLLEMIEKDESYRELID